MNTLWKTKIEKHTYIHLFAANKELLNRRAAIDSINRIELFPSYFKILYYSVRSNSSLRGSCFKEDLISVMPIPSQLQALRY